jgi:hypothetical protein
LRRKLGEQRHRDARVIDDRLGQRGTSRFLGHEHEIDVAQPETAGGLGREDTGQAELDEARPAIGGRTLVAVVRFAQRDRRAEIDEQLAHCARHRLVLLGEREIHVSRPAASRATARR